MASNHHHDVQETIEVTLSGVEAIQAFPQVAATVLGMQNPDAMLALMQHQLQQQMLMLQHQSQVLAQQVMLSQQSLKQLPSPPNPNRAVPDEQRNGRRLPQKRRPVPETRAADHDPQDGAED